MIVVLYVIAVWLLLLALFVGVLLVARRDRPLHRSFETEDHAGALLTRFAQD